MKLFLFQGDSITDAGRNYSVDAQRGYGYATMAAGILGSRYPAECAFINRGVSGNRIVDVYARIKKDIINLKPDFMSLLIGVNDIWHEVDLQNGVDTKKFERIYRMLLDETLEALPDLKLLLLQPFVLSGAATAEKYDYFRSECDDRIAAVQRIAADYGAKTVDLQAKLDAALSDEAASDYWLIDGVHPTAAGHALIAEEIVKFYTEVR